jgi:GT2 family glycosyltransferase
VDNASTDSTPLLLEQFARQVSFPVRVVRSSMRGVSRGRNAGLEQARGEIIAFTDDDCYPRADYLRTLVEVFEEHQRSSSSDPAHGLGFVGGRILLHNPADAKAFVRLVPTPIDVPARCFFNPALIHGANMAFRREVVSAIGGFDPLLGPGRVSIACEDTDYLARAVWAGWPGRYDPRLVVAHNHGRDRATADRHLRGYDYGRGAYYVKFLLKRDSRREYVRCWWRTTMSRPHPFPRLCRELAGAVRYLALRLVRREPVPLLQLPTTTRAS